MAEDEVIKKDRYDRQVAAGVSDAGFIRNLRLSDDGRVSLVDSMIEGPFDYIGVAYPSSTTETYTYRSGGASGTVVNVLTVTYTDSTKEDLASVERTT